MKTPFHTHTTLATLALLVPLAMALRAPAASAQTLRGTPTLRPGDHIAVVVNQELVTAFELNQRLALARADAQRKNQRLPGDGEFRSMMLESLIEERALLSHARDAGIKVDDNEIDRAVAVIAAQNQLTPQQLRQRLVQDGMDVPRFRANLRDQMMVERVREREVAQRIRITDGEIDALIDKQRGGSAAGEVQYNIAQVLIKIPEGSNESAVAERRARAEAALARIRGGEDFAAVSRQVSEDDNKERGGEIGLRPADKLPDIFLETVRPLQAGQLAPGLLRTGAGFHVLKLLDRAEGGALRVTQTRARHVLLRPSEQLTEAAVRTRLIEFKRQIESSQRRFEDIAREHSLDGSASAGGDLGWAAPGQFVPEFEQAMNNLAIGGVSAPVETRFGFHLIQVQERRTVVPDTKQLREQARQALRERKFEDAYGEWVREVRGRAYVEFREPPQ
jgi:peptidyl-prolyl cis-trans isomerase SurA